MKAKGKVLALVLSAAALVAASVFGTMAYLTDNESVTNTFTVGKVGLSLDETPVDENGDVVIGDRVQENEYKLVPGHTYTKDPTVHIDTDSESCWVFVKVTNGISEIEWDDGDYTNVATQIINNGWTLLESASMTPAKVYYKQWTKGSDRDLKVFDNFKIDGDSVTNTSLASYAEKSIVVKAYAVQLDGFENNASGAWTAAAFTD